MTMGIRDVVAELSYPGTESGYPGEMMDEALDEMLRYDDGTVISHDRDKGLLKVQIDCFHGGRWRSFGYGIVKVVSATGYTSRDGVYNPPQDLTGLFS